MSASHLSPIVAITAQFDTNSAQHGRLVEGRTSAELTLRPEPARWSIAEHVEHMSLTTEAYLPLLASAARELRERGLRSNGPYRSTWTGRLLAWMLEPPVRMRVKSAAEFVPGPAVDPTRVAERFADLQRALSSELAALDGYALDRVRIASPFNARVRYDVWSALRIIAVHQRRHLWLAERAGEVLARA